MAKKQDFITFEEDKISIYKQKMLMFELQCISKLQIGTLSYWKEGILIIQWLEENMA